VEELVDPDAVSELEALLDDSDAVVEAVSEALYPLLKPGVDESVEDGVSVLDALADGVEMVMDHVSEGTVRLLVLLIASDSVYEAVSDAMVEDSEAVTEAVPDAPLPVDDGVYEMSEVSDAVDDVPVELSVYDNTLEGIDELIEKLYETEDVDEGDSISEVLVTTPSVEDAVYDEAV
jgi:hypothetical protein